MKVKDRCARPTRRKRPPGWRTATIRRIADRKAHGHAAPLNVRHWQIGNETSYDRNGFDLETAARKTVEFAKGDACVRSRDSADRVGRQRLGGAHGGSSRRTRAVPRVPSHVRSRFAGATGAARRAVSARSGCRRGTQLMAAWQLTDAKIRTVRDSLGGGRSRSR